MKTKFTFGVHYFGYIEIESRDTPPTPTQLHDIINHSFSHELPLNIIVEGLNINVDKIMTIESTSTEAKSND